MQLIKPNWLAPAHIHAYSTTRLGGVSEGEFAGLNLGLHVQDEPTKVQANRELLAKELAAPPFYWLTQTHSCNLIKLDQPFANNQTFDASWIDKPGYTSVVMTADCLPLLVTDKAGSFVAAIHAGWRGLCDGIIEKSIKQIIQQQNVTESELLAWIGPCIGPAAFEVGNEVRDTFMAKDQQAAAAFTAHGEKWLADLPLLAKQRLSAFKGINISASELCTYSDKELFYSYRRDGQTGRLATFIWIAES